MAKKWPNSGWWAASWAFLGHFSPFHTNIYPDFLKNGTARLRCPSGVSRALFCRSETISKVGNIKIMSASSPFFFSSLSPPFSFLSRVVSRLMGVQKSRFRCRSGQNGQIFRSHLFKNPGRYCKQLLSDGKKWPNSGWWAASWAFLGHFSPFHAKANKCSRGRSSARIRSFFAIWQQLLAVSTWIFEKVAPEDLPILAGTTPKPGFLDSHEPRNHTGEKREGRGERGEEKRTAGTHNFYIAYFGESFWTTKKCSRHTARTPQPSGTVFKNPGIYWYEMG